MYIYFFCQWRRYKQGHVRRLQGPHKVDASGLKHIMEQDNQRSIVRHF